MPVADLEGILQFFILSFVLLDISYICGGEIGEIVKILSSGYGVIEIWGSAFGWLSFIFYATGPMKEKENCVTFPLKSLFSFT